MAYAVTPADYPAVLTRALVAASIPVVGVSIPDPNNRSTWRIDYHPTATVQNRVDGENLKLTLSFSDAAVLAREQGKLAQDEVLNHRAVQALATAIHKRFKASVPGDAVTPAQWAASIRAEFEALL